MKNSISAVFLTVIAIIALLTFLWKVFFEKDCLYVTLPSPYPPSKLNTLLMLSQWQTPWPAKWATRLICPLKCLSKRLKVPFTKTVTLSVRANEASLPLSVVVVGCASFAPFPAVAPSSVFPPGVSPGSYAPVAPWSPASSSRLFATEYK